MASRFESPEEENPQQQLAIDTSKRLDLYVREHPDTVVFKNVRILGQKILLEASAHPSIFEKFMEIEQADGTRIFILRNHISRICEHGVEIKCEKVKYG